VNVSRGDARERGWVSQYNRKTSPFYKVFTRYVRRVMKSHKLLGVRLEVEELRTALPNSLRYRSTSNYRNCAGYCKIIPK